MWLLVGIFVGLGIVFRQPLFSLPFSQAAILLGILLFLAVLGYWARKQAVLLVLLGLSIVGLRWYLLEHSSAGDRPKENIVSQAQKKTPAQRRPNAPVTKEDALKNQGQPLDQQLFQAIAQRNLQRVKQLISQGADVNAREPNGIRFSVLCQAVGGPLEMVQVLVDAGAEINTPRGEGFSPLGMAASIRRVDVADFLIQHGADVNLMSDRTPLMLAAESGALDVAERLLAAGADPNIAKLGYTPLKEAIKRENLPMVKLLISKGADVNFPDTWNAAFKQGYQPVIEVLVDAGMRFPDDPNGTAVQAFRGETAQVKEKLPSMEHSDARPYLLWWAAAGGKIDTVQMLLENGVTQRIADAFVAACTAGHTPIVNLLLKQNPPLSDRNKQQAFHAAVEHGFVDTVRVLLAAGWDPNTPAPFFGGMALVPAVRQGNVEMVRLLLDAGADVNRQDHTGSGVVPLHIAVEAGRLEVVKMLVEAGADVNRADQFGQTVMLRARSKPEIADYLRAHGAHD